MRSLPCLLILALGCGHLLPGGSVRCPASGGPEWRELRSKHFTLDTDLPEPEAAQWVKDLEQLEATVIAALTSTPRELPGRLRVVVAREESMYREIAPAYSFGYFTNENFFEEPTIVLHPDAQSRDPEVIAHELGHFASFHLFPRHPRWFEEGLVQFAGTVGNPNPKLHNLAGLMPSMRAREYAEGRFSAVDVAVLFEWKGRGVGELESWAFGLFHFLWNNQSDQLDDYQRRLLARASPDEAWRKAFPEYDPAKPGALASLGKLVDAHLRAGKFDAYYEVKASSDPSFTSSTLTAAQVHVLLLDIRRRWRGNNRGRDDVREDKPNLTRQELAAALQDDPNDPVAGVRLRLLNKEPALAGARAAAASHPNDWRAQALLSSTEAQGSKEQEAALRRAVALNPDNAAIENRLASVLIDRPEQALPFAQKAVLLAPDDPYNLETLAASYATLKKCNEALQLVDQASDRLYEYSSEELRDRLQHDRAQCSK